MGKRSSTDGLLEREQVGRDYDEMDNSVRTTPNNIEQGVGRRVSRIRRSSHGMVLYMILW